MATSGSPARGGATVEDEPGLTVNQVPTGLNAIIEAQLQLYREPRSIQIVNSIPQTPNIPIVNPHHWLRIPDVICVFVDMKGSTQLSAGLHDKSTAGAYQLFTGTAVHIFDYLEAPYIDVRGDGVFGLFNRNQVYRALAAAVSFKTFAADVFAKEMLRQTGLDVGAHIGIDQRTVLVRKIGMKRYDGRTDRQNEVWAGKPINMASKLAAIGDAGELHVSDRYYKRITHRQVRYSCGCNSPEGQPTELWMPVDLTDDPKFDFNTAYKLRSQWCRVHGKRFCEDILALD